MDFLLKKVGLNFNKNKVFKEFVVPIYGFFVLTAKFPLFSREVAWRRGRRAEKKTQNSNEVEILNALLVQT